MAKGWHGEPERHAEARYKGLYGTTEPISKEQLEEIKKKNTKNSKSNVTTAKRDSKAANSYLERSKKRKEVEHEKESARRYIKGIKNKEKREYAQRYYKYLYEGKKKPKEPEGLSPLTAKTVRMELNKEKPKEFPKKEVDNFEGGLADNTPDSMYKKEQMKAGIDIEMEHTDCPVAAKEISKDHMIETDKNPDPKKVDSDYYHETKGLPALEKKLEIEAEINHVETYDDSLKVTGEITEAHDKGQISDEEYDEFLVNLGKRLDVIEKKKHNPNNPHKSNNPGNPGDKVHTKKFDRCVKKVEKGQENKPESEKVNPYAVCTKSVGYERSIRKEHRRRS